MTLKSSLENNKIDLMTSVAKSAVGTVPIAGSFLSELVGNLIPNQRIDRLTKYVMQLDARLSKIPIEKLKLLQENDDFIDLIEEGFVQASRAISDERRLYISSIISNGIKEETIELQQSKHLLKILQELNDVEIIWLRFYLVPTIGGDEGFRKKNDNVLKRIQAFLGADSETLIKSAIQNSYKEHLERLELIQKRIKIDSKTGLPEFDRFSGKPKTSYTDITTLGRLLLKQIGLIEELYEK